MDNKKLFLHTNPLKLFLKASIPGGISMLMMSVYTVFDAIFVGKFVGSVALGGLGLAMPLVIINFSLADLIGVGSSVPIAILLGKKEDKKANEYFTYATLLIIITGIVIGLLLYFLAPSFMSLVGAKGDIAMYGVKYARVYAIFSPISTLFFAVDNYLRISGKIKTSMYLNIFMSIGTVLTELLFVVGFNWGIQGAAFGANIVLVICIGIAYSFFFTGKLQLKFVKFKANSKMLKEIVSNGTPAFLTNVAGRLFSIVMNIMLIKFGGDNAVVVYGILFTIGGIVEQMLYGVLDSLQPAIGYNYGANENQRVTLLVKYSFIAGAIISIFFAILMFVIPETLSSAFLNDFSLLEYSANALRLFSIAYLFKWISHTIQTFLLAIEKPLPALAISISICLVFPLVAIAILLPLKLDGLWLNYATACLLSAIFAVIMLIVMRKKLFLQKEKESE